MVGQDLYDLYYEIRKKAHFYEKWQEFYICQIRKYEVLDDI